MTIAVDADLSAFNVLALMQEEGWRPSITVTQILLGIQARTACTSCDLSLICHAVNDAQLTVLVTGLDCILVSCMLLILQDLLNDPNPNSPAQSDAYMLFTQKPAEYKRRVRLQTSAHPPPA